MELIMFTQLPAVQLISYPHIFHPSYFPYQEQNKNFPKGAGSSQLLALNALSCCLFVSLFQALLAAASQGCCCLAAYLFPSPRPLFSALFFCFKPDRSGIARQSWLSFPGAVGQWIDVDGARSPASSHAELWHFLLREVQEHPKELDLQFVLNAGFCIKQHEISSLSYISTASNTGHATLMPNPGK